MIKIFPFGKTKEYSMNSTYKTIHDVFERFQKDRHNEDKGRNFNTLQETYAKAELFDVSKMSLGQFPQPPIRKSDKFTIVDSTVNITLPFECMFIHVEDRQFAIRNELIQSRTYMFVREFSPLHITGTVYEISDEGRRNIPFTFNLPFVLNCYTGTLCIAEEDYLHGTSSSSITSPYFYSREALISLVYNTLSCIDSLNSKTIIADVPTTNRTIYYRRKGSPAIKVPARSIYYVINKHDTESEKHIAFTGTKVISHAFKVRGHWRTLENSEALGKDRQGNRIVKGFTWVTEYIKGDESNLVKKVRIVE